MDRQKDALYYTELLRTKKVSPEELIVDAFKKIDRENPRYNAVVHTRREKALHEARTRDFGNTLFGGVPILIKDLGQDLAGEPSTSGSRLLKDYVAPRTSHFVEAIERAGFIVIGQTSTPEFGFKNITDAVIHGPARNPCNRDHSPGGASGGARILSRLARGVDQFRLDEDGKGHCDDVGRFADCPSGSAVPDAFVSGEPFPGTSNRKAAQVPDRLFIGIAGEIRRQRGGEAGCAADGGSLGRIGVPGGRKNT